MTFSSYLQDHLNTHPAATGQDVLKFCYQAAHGPEHLIVDPVLARLRFEQEFDATPATDGPLIDCLSDRFCRIHMGAWRAAALPREWLLRLFLCSATPVADAKDQLHRYLSDAAAHLSDPAFDDLVTHYRADGAPPVHHSDAFRAAYLPAYRVVDCRLVRLLPVLEHLAAHSVTGRPTVIAIDGRAASGKSTVAQQLSDILDAAVVHMDDFFLPPALRTSERLATPGGNVHYERFAEQVLPHLGLNAPFCYDRFDCSVMRLTDTVSVPAASYQIVEGSYSTHPIFKDYADLRIFSDISPDEQFKRISVRNSASMAELFKTRWIPMEETYFKAYHIRENATLII